MRAALPSRDSKQTKTEALPRKQSKSRKYRIFWRLFLLLIVLLLITASAFLLREEARTSSLQARKISAYADTLDYSVGQGRSTAILYPRHGPFDHRLGYSQLPLMLHNLREQGFEVSLQTRFSPALLDYSLQGLFPPFDEKSQAGLTITDTHGDTLYRFSYPNQVYPQFADIPPLLVNTLLFIENRHLLNSQYSELNPAVDWPRLFKASLSQVGKQFAWQDQSAGGSTLATQLEKYRHSPGGRTTGTTEKARQMVSASVRTYRHGPQTMPARERIVRDYLNSVPLSAAPGHGEVHGLADGLSIWFGADFTQTNQRLANAPGTDLNAQALALRQVLALIIAQRRPSWYLFQGRQELDALIDSHLRLLASHQLIDAALRDRALATELQYRDWNQHSNLRPNTTSKGINAVRSRLSNTLGVPYYDLDRLDLHVRSTLDGRLQADIGDYLSSLADPGVAEQIGLFGERLLSPQSTAAVRYSFTLFENTEQGPRVRVQTDNTGQPFDLNEGSKLELGSTAKLRVLTTYLEVIAELHQRLSTLNRQALLDEQIEGSDHLTRWVRDSLLNHPQISLSQLLEAAMERRYSASPHEQFFTGGGLHSFGNFRREDDNRNPTLRDSLRESINLPFVRLMRDLVRYSMYQAPGNSSSLLKDDKDPRRDQYLQRFADREGKVFLMRFWRKYQNKSEAERLDSFLAGLRATPVRLAAVHRYLFPEAEPARFEAFLAQHIPNHALPQSRLDALYNNYGPGAWSLPDQGYIARVHPLELWLLGYLQNTPNATFKEAVSASNIQRQEVYSWLFKTRHKSARDVRIRTMLEVEAFLDIHERWRRVGYPFEHLVPSLATALGSSGDRPVALAELIGIIQNDGIRQPSLRLEQLHFAANTPYETQLQPLPQQAVRVLAPEVASTLRRALSQVVSEGTARRLQGSFIRNDGSQWLLGGKTGTGDNRIEQSGRGGQIISSTAINRTATFVFYIGPRHFGTLTAFVPGKQADQFRFTSALPLQVLKGMGPLLSRYLDEHSAIPEPDKLLQHISEVQALTR